MTAYPASLDTEDSLYRAVNDLATTLSSNVNSSQTTIPVSSIAGFEEPGLVSIDGEVIRYDTIQLSPPALLGATRGYDGTSAASHANAARVEARWVAAHHNDVVAAVVAVENELGTEPKGDFATVAERLTNIEPLIVPFSPATTDWSFEHERKRIVSIQLWRKKATNVYELFEANIEQEVDTGGTSQVNITLGATEEGYAVVL
jgi:hypothetical protein